MTTDPGRLGAQETVTRSPTKGQELTIAGMGLSLSQLVTLKSCPLLSMMMMVRMGVGTSLTQ